jgi:pimeloyl-ACP methyl ester carboxylesterase
MAQAAAATKAHMEQVDSVRIYGTAPYEVAVLHGGPGAPGQMAPVARELAREWGVVEPLQTAASLDGQVQELRNVLRATADRPVSLVGWSWGAMLGFITAASYPELVKKLILIGSAVYEDHYATGIQETRWRRLGEGERQQAQALLATLSDPVIEDKSTALAQFGALLTKADAYDPFTLDTEGLPPRYDIYQRVWNEAQALRRSGALLALGKRIACPVVGIHGDYDPHPREGVEQPLSATLHDFRFIVLEQCGHLPWIERQAKDGFYRVLKDSLRG